MLQQLKIHLKSLLIDDLGDTLAQIKPVLNPSSRLYNDYILIYARYNRTIKDYLDVTNYPTHIKVDLNRIRLSTTAFLDRLSEEDLNIGAVENLLKAAEKPQLPENDPNPKGKDTPEQLQNEKPKRKYPREPLDVFVSYSRKDYELELARKFIDEFKEFSLNKWKFFVDEETVNPGDKWDPIIKNAAKSCNVALLLISPPFLNSNYIKQYEWPAFLENEKERDDFTIIPVVLRQITFADLKHTTPWQTLPDYQFYAPIGGDYGITNYHSKELLPFEVLLAEKRHMVSKYLSTLKAKIDKKIMQ